jgi:hypothetical protein
MSLLKDIVLVARDMGDLANDIISCQLQTAVNMYKKTMANLLACFFMMVAGVVIAIGGLAMIVFGLHLWLTLYLGPVFAGLLLGAALLLISLLFFVAAKNKIDN